MCRDYIAAECKTEDADLLVRLSRYVDDILKSSENKEQLWSAVKDMKTALASYTFKVKKVFSNGLWHLQFDKENSKDDYDPTQPEVIFHHSWLWSEDTLSIIPKLNVFRKVRGAPGGPDEH